MTRFGWSFLSLTAVTAFAAVAGADLDLVLPDGAKVTATLADGLDVHTYRMPCPNGAKLTVSAKSAKGGPSVRLSLSDPVGGPLGSAAGRKPALKNVQAKSTGVYSIQVASSDGVASGGYTLSAAWKSPTAFKGPVDATVADRGEFGFSVDGGATAVVSLKPANRSHAKPVLAEIVGPDGTSTPLAAGASAALSFGSTGDYAVRFDDVGADGLVNVSVKVKPPKASKLSLTLAVGAVAPDAQVLASKTIGPLGGLLSIDSGPLSGASVQVPAGALGSQTGLLLGRGPAISGQASRVGAGPTVFVGPEGLAFASGKTATVTIPFDPATFSDGTSKLLVFTRDAAGIVTQVTNPTIDAGTGSVTFPASHFSSFQVLRDFHLAETQQLADSQASGNEGFGGAVSIDGDVAAVGVTGRSIAQNPQVVIVFHRTGGTWVREATLSIPVRTTFQSFFGSVAVSGSRVLVGTPAEANQFGNDTGTALVYLRDSAGNWSEETELPLPSVPAHSEVGSAVALEGDTAVVAAPFDNLAGQSSGAVHVFVRDTTSGLWSLQQTLRASQTGGGSFGRAIALSGDTLVVGEPANAGGFGAAHVFRRSAGTWSEAPLIQPADLTDKSQFATSVTIDGTTIVVGSSPPPVGEDVSPGGVRIFDDQGASFPEVARFESADLVPKGVTPNSQFGYSLAVRGGILIASAPSETLTYPSGKSLYRAGDAYVFQRLGATWSVMTALRGPSSGATIAASVEQAFFGGAVAFDGATALVSGADAGETVFVEDLSGN